MRTHQRWLMLLITIMTIAAFVWFYNAPQLRELGTGTVARVYGKNFTYTDLQKDARMLQLALMLGLTQYASSLEGTNFTQDPSLDFVLNSIVVRHEGAALGINPTDTQVADAIKKLPVFLTDGNFDIQKYNLFIEKGLSPRGFVPKHIDDIVRDSLILDEITKLIETAPTATDAEIAAINRSFEPATGAAILFTRADFLKDAKVTDEDIDAAYTVAKPTYVTPEWRTAKFVRFKMPEGYDKLDQQAKIQAQQKVADEASAFSEKAATDGFDPAANALNYKVELTLPFDRQGQLNNPAGVGGLVPELAGPATALAPTVFTLTKASPVSGVIRDGNDFLVAELDEVTESRQLSLEEARSKIVDELSNIAAEKLLQEHAMKVADDVRAALKAGKTFAEATAGMQTVPFKDIAPLGDNPDSTLKGYADATVSVKDNEISGFLPSPTGGAIVWLEKRNEADEAGLNERREQIADYIVSRKRAILLYEWLEWARDKAGLQLQGIEG